MTVAIILVLVLIANFSIYYSDRAYVAALLFTHAFGHAAILAVHSLAYCVRWLAWPITRRAPLFLIPMPTPEEVKNSIEPKE